MSVPSHITQTLPLFMRVVVLPLLNHIGTRSEFRLIISSPDYVQFEVFWGLVSFEKGEKREFVIKGTQAYVSAIVSSLEKKRLDTKLNIIR
jgi:hypothetical protein